MHSSELATFFPPLLHWYDLVLLALVLQESASAKPQPLQSDAAGGV